jgi:hypothetical protein
VSDHPELAKLPSGSSSSDSSQVLMLSLQMQALALTVEEIRGRVARIERHLKLHGEDADVRDDLRKLRLERIW